MTKLLYSISAVLMISAFFLFGVCGLGLSQGTVNFEELLHGGKKAENSNYETSILDRFKMIAASDQVYLENFSPLVETAAAFALFLNPPQPPVTVIAKQPEIEPQPVYRPSVTARFKLLSTSCSLSKPENSWALVSEPGRGEHWVTSGERVGNFIVQSIEKGAIVYKDGNQIQKMNITVKEPPQLAQVRAQDKISIIKPQNNFENE